MFISLPRFRTIRRCEHFAFPARQILWHSRRKRNDFDQQKKHGPEEIVAKLRHVDVLVSQGQSVAEAVRSIGVTQFTYYRWRKEYGGLKTDKVKRLKELEKENERLREAVSDLTLEKLILREAASGTEDPRQRNF